MDGLRGHQLEAAADRQLHGTRHFRLVLPGHAAENAFAVIAAGDAGEVHDVIHMRTGDAQFVDQLAFQRVRIAAGGGLENVGDALGAAVETLVEHGAAGGREHLVFGFGHFPGHRPGAALGGQFLILTGGQQLGLRHQLETGLLQLLFGIRADAVGDALHLRIAHAF